MKIFINSNRHSYLATCILIMISGLHEKIGKAMKEWVKYIAILFKLYIIRHTYLYVVILCIKFNT